MPNPSSFVRVASARVSRVPVLRLVPVAEDRSACSLACVGPWRCTSYAGAVSSRSGDKMCTGWTVGTVPQPRGGLFVAGARCFAGCALAARLESAAARGAGAGAGAGAGGRTVGAGRTVGVAAERRLPQASQSGAPVTVGCRLWAPKSPRPPAPRRWLPALPLPREDKGQVLPNSPSSSPHTSSRSICCAVHLSTAMHTPRPRRCWQWSVHL